MKKIKGKQKSNQIADELPIPEAAIERQLGSLFARQDEIVRNLILERQGAATNVRHAGVWADRSLRQTAEGSIRNSPGAKKAVKIVKQAKRLGEKEF